MKKIIGLLVVLMVFSAPAAVAQFTPEVGIRVGGEFSQLRGNQRYFGQFDNKLSDIRSGFTAGVLVGLPVAENLFIQPELLYAQKGGQDNFLSEEGDRTRENWGVDYVELPVLLRYDIQTSSRLVPSVYAGPYAAYAVRRHIDREVRGGEDFSSDVDDVIERWDYGAAAGVDLGYRFARRTAMIGARYDLGLANILQEEFRDGDETWRTGGTSVMLGLRF